MVAVITLGAPRANKAGFLCYWRDNIIVLGKDKPKSSLWTCQYPEDLSSSDLVMAQFTDVVFLLSRKVFFCYENPMFKSKLVYNFQTLQSYIL